MITNFINANIEFAVINNKFILKTKNLLLMSTKILFRIKNFNNWEIF